MSVELHSNTQAVSAELQRKTRTALYVIGNVVLEHAVEAISGTYTPDNLAVDTGRLRASLSYVTPFGEVKGKSPTAGPVQPGDRLEEPCEDNTVVIGTNVEYAEFVHNGTVKMRARPFLTEGVQTAAPRIEELLNAILGEDNYTIEGVDIV